MLKIRELIKKVQQQHKILQNTYKCDAVYMRDKRTHIYANTDYEKCIEDEGLTMRSSVLIEF